MFGHPRNLLIMLLMSSTWAMAYDSVTFVTSQDTFTVNKKGRSFDVGGTPFKSDLLTRLAPLLTGPATNDCPKLSGKPLLTARVSTNGKIETREFFVSANIIRVGNTCLSATGEGMYYLPLHRRWLVGPFKDSLTLRSPLTLTSGSDVLVSLVKKGGDWVDNRDHSELDWDFWNRFEQSLQDYRISYRVLPEAGVGKPEVVLKSGSEQIKFVQVAPKTWAIQRPGQKWLDASGDWSFWFDLDPKIFRDRYANEIEKAESTGLTAEQRLNAMKDLDSAGWSRAIESFYQRRLADAQEDLNVRAHALERLKSKPAWRNIRAEMEALMGNPPDDLLNLLTLALRVRNPKGPVFDPASSERPKIVHEWREWWNENSNRKD